MNIEDTIFKRSKLNIDSLLKYGFKIMDNNYILKKNILKDTFEVEVKINNQGKVLGKIIDKSTNEEYKNFRISELNGTFVNKVREEYEKVLIDIKNNCFDELLFMSNQANRIVKLIKDEYRDDAEFLWEKDDAAVFRNKNNKNKWYGIIMNIPKNRLDSGNELVDVINVKLNPLLIESLLKKEGFYKAYHMNKKYWISIILNDTLQDDEIINLIRNSHEFTEK